MNCVLLAEMDQVFSLKKPKIKKQESIPVGCVLPTC